MANSESNQRRPGLREIVNARYPGAMIRKLDAVPLAKLTVDLARARVAFVSSAGVQLKDSLPFDVAQPIGDHFSPLPPTFRRRRPRYPSLSTRRPVPAATSTCFSYRTLARTRSRGRHRRHHGELFLIIGYNMNPVRFESSFSEELADAMLSASPDVVLLSAA
jgi:hypothetical protein